MVSTSQGRGLYPACSQDEWNQLAARGQVLLDQMRGNEDLDRPPFVKDHLKRWGWTRNELQQTNDSLAILAGLDRLRGVQGLDVPPGNTLVDKNSSRDWKVVQTVQDRQYKLLNGRRAGPTTAAYTAIYNTRARVLSWTQTMLPGTAASQMSNEELPALRNFSDIGFLTYASISTSISVNAVRSGSVSPVNWLHIPHINHDQTTLSTITAIMVMLGHNGSLPDFPVTVPVGTQAFNALLATPLIGEMANLHIRNKYCFGPTVVASITIYPSWTQTVGAQADHDTPGVLMHVTRYDDWVEKFRSENEDYEIRFAAQGPHDWPHKMKPTIRQSEKQVVELWRPLPRPPCEGSEQAPVVAGSSIQQNPTQTVGGISLADPLSSLTLGLHAEYELKKEKGLLEQGQHLLDAMLDRNFAPPQAPLVRRHELKDHGWKISELPLANPERLRFLEGYVGLEDLVGTPEGPGHSRPHNPMSISNPGEWIETEDNCKPPSICGKYRSLISVKHHVLALLESRVPYPQGLNPTPNPQNPNSQTMPGPLPDVLDWGEVVLAEYCNKAGIGWTRPGRPPRWWPILATEHMPANPFTQQIIDAFLETNGLDSVPFWPGITFPIGTIVHTQLLATPEINHFVGPFIKHKDVFGDYAVASITVFNTNPNSRPAPSIVDVNENDDHSHDVELNFVAYLTLVTKDLQGMLQDNRDFEMREEEPFPPKDQSQPKGPLSSKDGPNWPFPLRPIREGPPGPKRKPQGRDKGSGSGSSSKDKGKGKDPDSGRGGFRNLLSRRTKP